MTNLFTRRESLDLAILVSKAFIGSVIFGCEKKEFSKLELELLELENEIEANPTNGEAYHNLGQFYLRLRYYINAESEFKSAINNGFNNAMAYVILGRSQRAQKTDEKINQAIKSYHNARKLNHKNPEAYYLIGEANFFRSGFEYKDKKESSLVEATYYFGKAAQLDRQNEAYPYFLGRCYWQLSLLLKNRGKYIEDQNERTIVLDGAKSRYNKAIGFFNQVVKLNPNGNYASSAETWKKDLIAKFKAN